MRIKLSNKGKMTVAYGEIAFKNTVAKGEIAHYEQFLLLPQVFKSCLLQRYHKNVYVWENTGWTVFNSSDL